MTTQWDRSVDLLIVGSGGGGMVAGLAALDSGIEPLIIEKQALVGGSTGLSGGMVWLPNNPLMRADGIPDSHEDGLAYFDDVVGDIGATLVAGTPRDVSHRGLRDDQLSAPQGCSADAVPGLERLLPEHKGGNEAGRAIEGIPYNAAGLGDWSDKVQPLDGQELRRTSCSRPTNCVRCSISIDRRGPSPWRQRCSRVPARPSCAVKTPHQRRLADRSDAQGGDRLARPTRRSGPTPQWRT